MIESPVYNPDVMTGRPPIKEAPPFGKRLSALRKARNLTQQQLADMLGMTVKGIDYYERRAKNPSMDFVQRTAEVLNVAIMDLVDTEKRSGNRRGPSPKLQQQLEAIHRLPKSKQRFVSELLDTVLKTTE